MPSGPLCVSLTPKSLDDAFRADVEGADCIEVRLDYLEDPQQSLNGRWDRLPAPVIATCRGRDRGGSFKGSIEDEAKILLQAVRNGARYVDIDYRFVRPFPGAKVIASFHDFSGTPSNIADILTNVCSTGAEVAKVATLVNSWSDNRRLLDLFHRPWPKPAIVVGMGEIGQITRVLGPSRGSALTYAAATDASAPGQLTLKEMLEVYRFRRLRSSTRVVGIIGKPLEHSLSPALHNRGFDALGLDFIYLKFPTNSLEDFFENAETIGIHGFSVTLPHKVEVLRFLSEQSNAALAAGAANTVIRVGDRWIGDNTDVYGIREALKTVHFDPSGKRIVILGSGGAARAAVAALGEAREIILLTRRPVSAEAYARTLVVDRLENLPNYPCDLLINATPAGMAPAVGQSPVEGDVPAEVVFDMVYNPPATRLLRLAREQGKTVIGGMSMFVAQAARQFELWTGCPAPPTVFKANIR